jgi:hypothetical protein
MDVCLLLVSCCQVEVSLVQKSPTDCGVSLCVWSGEVLWLYACRGGNRRVSTKNVLCTTYRTHGIMCSKVKQKSRL